MNDLPTRLRTEAEKRDHLTAGLMRAAADEIERLTRERDGAMEEANAADARVVAIACENAGLESELARVRPPASSPIVKAEKDPSPAPVEGS